MQLKLISRTLLATVAGLGLMSYAALAQEQGDDGSNDGGKDVDSQSAQSAAGDAVSTAAKDLKDSEDTATDAKALRDTAMENLPQQAKDGMENRPDSQDDSFGTESVDHPEPPDHPDGVDHPEPPDHPEGADIPETPEHPEIAEIPEPPEHPEDAEVPEPPEHPEPPVNF